MQQQQQVDEVHAALRRDLEAARYRAHRAGKQYDACDPENRLVADELERRWNAALADMRALETRLAEQTQSVPKSASFDEFADLAADLDAVWRSPAAEASLKKRIVRALIEEVVADCDSQANEILLTIHWKGGVHTELRLPRRRRGQMNHTAAPVVDAVRSLARLCSDDVIAGVLNRNGLKSGRGNRWTRERVVSLRSYHEIPCHSDEQCAKEGWLKLRQAADIIGVSPTTLRLAIERGEIHGEHPLPDGPWVINRSDLQTEATEQVRTRAQNRSRNPAKPGRQQRNLGFSST